MIDGWRVDVFFMFRRSWQTWFEHVHTLTPCLAVFSHISVMTINSFALQPHAALRASVLKHAPAFPARLIGPGSPLAGMLLYILPAMMQQQQQQGRVAARLTQLPRAAPPCQTHLAFSLQCPLPTRRRQSASSHSAIPHLPISAAFIILWRLRPRP